MHLSLANCWFLPPNRWCWGVARELLIEFTLKLSYFGLLLTRAGVLFIPLVRVLQFTSHPLWEIPHLNKCALTKKRVSGLSQLPLGGLAPDP